MPRSGVRVSPAAPEKPYFHRVFRVLWGGGNAGKCEALVEVLVGACILRPFAETSTG